MMSQSARRRQESHPNLARGQRAKNRGTYGFRRLFVFFIVVI
jgi:hypothetical protein